VNRPTIRTNDDGTLDEIVAGNAHVHLEQMADGHWWLLIRCGGQDMHVDLCAEGRISASYFQEMPPGSRTEVVAETLILLGNGSGNASKSPDTAASAGDDDVPF
jgi:hypothetical protein